MDYVLVSARRRKVVDFVAIEWQTVDTTGTVWPERQRFASLAGISVPEADAVNRRGFGMNWKMTSKTILMQLHHKIEILEYLNKHLVLVVQDHLLEEMRKSFSFDHMHESRMGDSMHIHSYCLASDGDVFRLELNQRLSTDAAGVAACMGIQADPKMELVALTEVLEKKISDETLLALDAPALAQDAPELRQE